MKPISIVLPLSSNFRHYEGFFELARTIFLSKEQAELTIAAN